MKAVDEQGRQLFLVGGVWYVIEDGRPVVRQITEYVLARLDEPEMGTA